MVLVGLWLAALPAASGMEVLAAARAVTEPWRQPAVRTGAGNSGLPGNAARRALSAPVWGQVAVANVNVRTGPGTNHQILTTLRGGDHVFILAQTDGWYEIECPASAAAWVARESVRPDGAVKGARVRVRVAANPAAAVLRELGAPDQVQVIGCAGDWCRIKPPAGAVAYINSKLVISGVRPPTGNAPQNPAAAGTSTDPEPAASSVKPPVSAVPPTAQPGLPEPVANRAPEIQSVAAGVHVLPVERPPIVPASSASVKAAAQQQPSDNSLPSGASQATGPAEPQAPSVPAEAAAASGTSQEVAAARAPAADKPEAVAPAETKAAPPAQAPTADADTSKPAEDSLVEELPEPAAPAPESIVVVPSAVRAAVDTDELGTLLPPPSFARTTGAADAMAAAGSTEAPDAPGHAGEPKAAIPARPAAGPLVLRIPAPQEILQQVRPVPELPEPKGPAPAADRLPTIERTRVYSFENAQLALLNGIVEPAPGAPFAGVGHRLVQEGKPICYLSSLRPAVTLEPFAGRRVEVLGIVSENVSGAEARLVQVCAVHPLD